VERRIKAQDPTLLTFGPDPCKTIFGRLQSVYHHITSFGSNAKIQESDPEFDMINVTITPNFPLGDVLEKETGVERGRALVVKRDANTLQLVDAETLGNQRRVAIEQDNNLTMLLNRTIEDVYVWPCRQEDPRFTLCLSSPVRRIIERICQLYGPPRPLPELPTLPDRAVPSNPHPVSTQDSTLRTHLAEPRCLEHYGAS
jgi:hypothetical protein